MPLERKNITYSNHCKPTRLTPKQLDETSAKDLCLNCGNKNSRGHKFGDKKVF